MLGVQGYTFHNRFQKIQSSAKPLAFGVAQGTQKLVTKKRDVFTRQLIGSITRREEMSPQQQVEALAEVADRLVELKDSVGTVLLSRESEENIANALQELANQIAGADGVQGLEKARPTFIQFLDRETVASIEQKALANAKNGTSRAKEKPGKTRSVPAPLLDLGQARQAQTAWNPFVQILQIIAVQLQAILSGGSQTCRSAADTCNRAFLPFHAIGWEVLGRMFEMAEGFSKVLPGPEARQLQRRHG